MLEIIRTKELIFIGLFAILLMKVILASIRLTMLVIDNYKIRVYHQGAFYNSENNVSKINPNGTKQ